MTRNEFELLYAIKKIGKQSFRRISEEAGVSLGFISKTVKAFNSCGWICDSGITEEGTKALKPYKVRNAIIFSEECPAIHAPLGTEQAKGLRKVKDNTIAVEQLIEQLRDSGIKDIVLVLGYQKEAFFHPESKQL